MSEYMRYGMVILGAVLIAVAAFWPRDRVVLSRGAATKLEPVLTPDVAIGGPAGNTLSLRDGFMERFTLSSGSAPSFSFTHTSSMKGGLMWREGRIVYIDGASKEITREQLRERLTADEWKQVEEAERNGNPGDRLPR